MKKIVIYLVFLICSNSFACIWDRDTFAMEKQTFPSAYELITGNFVRHSKEYYQWRILKLQPLVNSGSIDGSVYDDLATAYSKLDQDKKAIELMLLKDKISDKKYETFANLGTFYIHDGQYEEGLKYIDKAIKINPDAHFGREVYQKYLVEYVIQIKKGKKYEQGFYQFLLENYKKKYPKNKEIFKLPDLEIKKAVKGILGMMRFGNYDSPVLLKALGDLLINEDHNVKLSSSRLAVMAYTKAEMKTTKKFSKNFLDKMNDCLMYLDAKMNKFDSILQELNNGIEIGKSNMNSIKKDEIYWIKNDLNVDNMFQKKYFKKNKK